MSRAIFPTAIFRTDWTNLELQEFERLAHNLLRLRETKPGDCFVPTEPEPSAAVCPCGHTWTSHGTNGCTVLMPPIFNASCSCDRYYEPSAAVCPRCHGEKFIAFPLPTGRHICDVCEGTGKAPDAPVCRCDWYDCETGKRCNRTEGHMGAHITGGKAQSEVK